MAQQKDVVVIGAGIVGICTAAYLAEAGRSVTVIDRTGICEETSSGNAAALAFSDILPLVQKGMIAQVPRWLLDPLGPLAVRPTYLPRLLPWLWRFLRAGGKANFEKALDAQASLMGVAAREWPALMDRADARAMLREDGCLELYESEEEFAKAGGGWALQERYGIAFRHLEQAELAGFQPGLSDRFVRGTFVPGWKTVTDPQRLGKAIWRHAKMQGAEHLAGEVVFCRRMSGGVAVQLREGRTIMARRLVIAAGAWSHRLARHFGDRVPLETERGYNTTLPADAFDVKRMLIFPRHGFVITPLETGLRVGGAVEFAGLEYPPNYARAAHMLRKAAAFLPGLKTEGGRQWMGYRPSLPDSLPVIGTASGGDNVVYAFGHGHLGLTQAAATGSLVRDLVLGRKPALDLSPFRAQRF